MVERTITIDAPIETVFKVIRDFRAYPDFVPATVSAVETQKTGADIEVDFKIQVVKSLSYTLLFKMEEPIKVEWTLKKGELMKKNSGFWKLKKLSENQTEAIYGVDVDFGWFVPKKILDEVTRVQLPQTLNAFKKRAEEMKSK